MVHDNSAPASESALEFAARLWLRTALVVWGMGGLLFAVVVLRLAR